MRILIVLISASMVVTACMHQRKPTRLRARHATCEATCDYYQYCRGDQNQARLDVCLSDCRSIFSEDGEIDRRSLLDLQRLECTALLSFIEGDDNRPLGSSEI